MDRTSICSSSDLMLVCCAEERATRRQNSPFTDHSTLQPSAMVKSFERMRDYIAHQAYEHLGMLCEALVEVEGSLGIPDETPTTDLRRR